MDMVLAGQISRAFQKMSVVDEEDVVECLNDISRALQQADVRADLINKLSVNVKKAIINPGHSAGYNTRNMMQQAVFNELCALLETVEPAYTPLKGRQCVVMFIGLQGSGKTTTCTKYAHYYQKKGWKPSLVCADTFTADAFDQLKQNATKANIPFFGSYTEPDPVTIAKQGIEKFKKENSDLIIVDTSGWYKQEASLFKEIRQVSEMMSPDLIVFVMDSSIGQAAFEQAQEFKQNVPVGAVIITKMDVHAKGGAALTLVAGTKNTVIFLGTGEHMDDLEPFEVNSYVSRLLGIGDGSRLLNKTHDVTPMYREPKHLQKLFEEGFTLRKLYDQFQSALRMGPLNQVFPSIPGVSSVLMPADCGKERHARIKKLMMIMDSMSDADLDNPNLKMFSKPSRINRIARGSGHTINDVHELLELCERLGKAMKAMKLLRRTQHGSEAISSSASLFHLPCLLLCSLLGKM